MSKIEQNKQRKRAQILSAAQTIFLSEGYVLASMDRIAALGKMTKQTLYRYFPSKIALFQATLQAMGTSLDESYTTHLQHDDIDVALTHFAKAFISFHLSENHLATFRLLVAESNKAPEIVSSFMEVGPDDTHRLLTVFFTERLNVKECDMLLDLWLGMLLSLRTRVLIGMLQPSQQQIDEYAQEAVSFLLKAIR